MKNESTKTQLKLLNFDSIFKSLIKSAKTAAPNLKDQNKMEESLIIYLERAT